MGVRPNYVCLPLSDCLYLAAHVCLWGCGEWLNCTREYARVCEQVASFFFFSFLQCMRLRLHNHADSLSHTTPTTHHSSLPASPRPRCHLSTREAFPQHTANKVGQVRGWALFLSESNFQVAPTGKQVPAASDNETITRSFPPPLTSAGLLPYVPVHHEHCPTSA